MAAGGGGGGGRGGSCGGVGFLSEPDLNISCQGGFVVFSLLFGSEYGTNSIDHTTQGKKLKKIETCFWVFDFLAILNSGYCMKPQEMQIFSCVSIILLFRILGIAKKAKGCNYSTGFFEILLF